MHAGTCALSLIEYNVRNIFLEKSYTTIPRPFSKKSELSVSLDQYSKVLYSLYYTCYIIHIIHITQYYTYYTVFILRQVEDY